MNLTFNDTYITLQYEERGIKIVKHVSIESFLNAVNSDIEFSIPMLPKNAISYKKRGTVESLSFIHKAGKKNIIYASRMDHAKKHKFTVPTPDSVWIISRNLVNNKLVSLKTFALKEEFSGVDTVLYHFPFNNVYGNGTVCYGGSGIDKLLYKNVYAIQNIPDMFFSSPFNDDLMPDLEWRRNTQTNDSYYQFLSENETFPLNILKPVSKYGNEWREANNE